MSLLKSFPEFSIFEGLKIQNKCLNNSSEGFNKTNLIFYENLKKSSNSTIERLKKNGSIENEINGINSFEENETKSIESSTKSLVVNNNINNDINNTLYQNIQQSEQKNNKIGIKLLEPKFRDFSNSEDLTVIKDLKEKIYEDIKNPNLYNQFSHKIPLISSLFTKNNKFVKSNISPYQIKLINIKDISPPFEVSSLKVKEPIRTKIINVTDLKENSIKKKYKNKKFCFVPQNFLINFNIKEINIQNTLFNRIQQTFNFGIEISDVENFWKNMCRKTKIINSKNGNIFEYINEEYIEFKQNFYEEIKYNVFLQNKRKLNLDYEEFNYNLSYKYKAKLKKTQLKKIKKKITKKDKRLNKIKNSRNGEYIDVFLNQICIKKNYLEYFPFCPILKSKDNITIHILKGIFEEIDGLKLKKKQNLIKDERNSKYMENKRFILTYENKEKSKQYIIHINDFNILYLIYYYFYQIKETILLINDLFICHQSKEKILVETNIAENLIKNYNQIIKEISK